MKEIKIKIYGWSDLKKWIWDRFRFPKRKLIVEWLDDYGDEASRLFEKLLFKYNKEDLEKDNYAALHRALKDWDEEIKKIRDITEKLIMMK